MNTEKLLLSTLTLITIILISLIIYASLTPQPTPLQILEKTEDLCREAQHVNSSTINLIFEMDMRGELKTPLTTNDITKLNKLEEFINYCK